jgi:hypothetical protein
MHQPVFSHILKKTIYCFMAQYRPMMAGHPLTQQRKEEEKEDFYTTSLHLAALEGDTKAVAELLKAGQFVEAPDHDLKTPLHLAAACEAPVERSTLLLVVCLQNSVVNKSIWIPAQITRTMQIKQSA